MTVEEAEAIYKNPEGSTKEELIECLKVLNEQMQPIVLTRLQVLALEDAFLRLSSLPPERKEVTMCP